MKRFIWRVAVLCLLAACAMAVYFIRTRRDNQTHEQLAKAITPQANLEAVLAAEPRVEPEIPFRDLQAAAETIALGELDEAITERLQRLADEEASNGPDDLFVRADRDTILDHQVCQRRTEWYREAWLGSFQKYSRKDPAWASRAEEFLEKTATARQYGQSIPLQTRIELRPLALDLLKSGCDDAVVWADLLCVLDPNSPEHKQIREQLFERFLDSDYPAHTAFWTGCPHIGAERLLKIQSARRAAGGEGATSPFEVSDPIDQRILLELILARHRLMMLRNPLNKNPLWALGMNNSSPWLKKMILAHYTFSGTVDQSVMMAMAGQRVDPRSKEFAQIWDTLRRDPGFGDKLAHDRVKFAANLLVSAWHEVPENPEAATLILDMTVEDIRLEQNRVRLDVPGPAWFREALRAQLDYRPAYHTFQAWLGAVNYSYPERSRAAAARLAGECLESGRFDTIVPALYFEFMDFAAQPLVYSATGPVINMDKSPTYARPEVRQAIEQLVAGYEKHPPHGVDLNVIKSRLVCAAFAAHDFDGAAAKLEELGDSYDPVVFQSFGFSPRQLRREIARRNAQLPFDLGSGNSVRQLAFARGGSALLALGSDGLISAFRLPDGEAAHTSEHSFQTMAIPMTGSQFIAQADQGLSFESLASFKSVNAVKAGQLVPINAAADAQKYWATADQAVGGDKLTLNLRNFNDGGAEISIATSFVEIRSLSLASQKLILAVLGLARAADSSQMLPYVAVWNLETNERLYYDRPDSMSVSGLSLAPDGMTVALRGTNESAGNGGRITHVITVLDVASGKTLWTSENPHAIGCVQFLDDGNRLVTAAADRIVRVWSRDNGKPLATLVGHNAAVRVMALASGLSLLATGDTDGRVKLWDIKENLLRSREPACLGDWQFPFVHRLAVDPTTQDIVTCSDPEGTIRWRKDAGYQADVAGPYGLVDWTADGRMLLLIPKQLSGNDDVVSSKTFSLQLQGPAAEDCVPAITIESPRYAWGRIFPDGKSLLTTGDVATVWNLETGKPRRWGLLLGHSSPVMSVEISADGNRMATLAHRIDYPAGIAAEVRVWEVPSDPDRSEGTAKTLFHHQGNVLAMDLSADGNFVLLVDGDGGRIDVREVGTGRSLGTLKGSEAQFSPLRSQVAVIDGGSEILIYELPSLKVAGSLPWGGSGPQSLCWGPGGRTLCFVVAGRVHCMDVDSGEELVPSTSF